MPAKRRRRNTQARIPVPPADQVPTDPAALLWAEQVAALCGMRQARSVRWHASKSRRHLALLREADPAAQLPAGWLPLPVGYVLRTVEAEGQGGTRAVRSPQWRRADIDHFTANRLGPGGRRKQEVPSA